MECALGMLSLLSNCGGDSPQKYKLDQRKEEIEIGRRRNMVAF